MDRKTAAIAIAGAASATVLIVGGNWWQSASASTLYAGDGRTLTGRGDTPPFSPVSFASATLCTTGAPISIESIVPVDPVGGLRVVYWGIRPNSWQLTGSGQEFSMGGPGYMPRTEGMETYPNAIVSAKCATDYSAPDVDILSEVILTVERDASQQFASTKEFVITYRSGRFEKSLPFTYGVGICAEGFHDTINEAC